MENRHRDKRGDEACGGGDASFLPAATYRRARTRGLLPGFIRGPNFSLSRSKPRNVIQGRRQTSCRYVVLVSRTRSFGIPRGRIRKLKDAAARKARYEKGSSIASRCIALGSFIDMEAIESTSKHVTKLIKPNYMICLRIDETETVCYLEPEESLEKAEESSFVS